MQLKDLRNVSKDDLLEALGLETRKSATDYLLPAMGMFGAGVAVGAVLGLLFAPKSGRMLRSELGEKLGRGAAEGRQRIEAAASEMGQR